MAKPAVGILFPNLRQAQDVGYKLKTRNIFNMIWYNIRTLEKKLRQGDLSDGQTFNYIIAYVIILAFASTSTNRYKTDWLLYIDVIVTTIIAIIGLKKTFDINSTGDNKDYFKRLISLSFVSGIILVSYLVSVAIVFVIIDEIFKSKFYSLDLIRLSTNIIKEIVYYFILIKSFFRVNNDRR